MISLTPSNPWESKTREDFGNVQPKRDENWEQLYERLNNEIFTPGRENIHAAAKHGCSVAIQKLVLKKNVEIDTEDSYGITPLAYAIFSGSVDSVNTLLQLEANPHATVFNESPLTYARSVAKREGSGYEIINMLVRKMTHVDVNLISEVARENDMKLLTLIKARGLDLNRQNSKGENTFHHLINCRKSVSHKVANWLVENGVKVDLPNNDGVTPLHLAMAQKNAFWIDILLSNGASLFAKDSEGHSTFAWALMEGPPEVMHEQIQKAMLIDLTLNVGLPLLTYGMRIWSFKKRWFG